MKIEYFKPDSPILQKYIEGYYFLENFENDSENNYLTFPNNYCIVSVIDNCKYYSEKEKFIVKENKNYSCSSTIISEYKKPIHLEYYGSIRELTIYFKPLGINNFLTKKLCSYLNNSFQIFEPFVDYLITMQHILEIASAQKAKELLENYFLSKLTSFDGNLLRKAIQLLEDIEKDFTIQQVADSCGTSRQNLVKMFKIHLGKTPSDFKKINRFRNALNKFQDQKKIKNLSSLLIDSSFYDQSHLIKDFKSLTGMSPKDFFKNLDCNKGQDIKWLWM